MEIGRCNVGDYESVGLHSNQKSGERHLENNFLTHCGRVTQICVFNTVKLGTSASSP